MVHNVVSLHQIAGGDGVKFPFSIKEYQRYIFGDGKLAHRFGTDLAKAFIAKAPGFGAVQTTINQNPSYDFAVAVLSGYVPTASNSLRNYFTAYLNRHLASIKAQLACKIDLIGFKHGEVVRRNLHATVGDEYHIDRAHLGRKTIVVLGDIRLSQNQEDAVANSLARLEIANTVVFAYLATLDPATTIALSPTLSTIVSPSPQDVDSIAQSENFTMNDVFARSVLGRDYVDFCRLLRGKDDFFARLLLDYAIGGGYYEDELYSQNFKFLQWEISARESI
ncbi:PRTase ComF-like protein [Phaeosphaeriaceae sp. PMI808]|nr:PRTase ComF-like protein [Phaeosphaeriaceae sp. PMI808]